MISKDLDIAVLGSGSWGTALANHLAGIGFSPILYSRNNEIVEDINSNKVNSYHLPKIKLNSFLTKHISEFNNHSIIINTIPTQFITEFYNKLNIDLSLVKLINGSKGIELKQDHLIHEIFIDDLGVKESNYCTITGPSHAEEVAQSNPTAIVAASKNHSLAVFAQELFSSDYFRVYTSHDLIGCELGGALKNVVALASGIVVGLNLGDNVNAALLTRGLAEIMRLGEAIGGERLTFAGLSGLGDLFVTCSSNFSRNRKAGILIANGKSVEEIEKEHNFVAEGIYTAKSALDLARSKNIELPITEQVNEVLFNKKDPETALRDLMLRDKRKEFLG